MYDGGELKPMVSDGSWACVLPLAPNPRVLGYSCGGTILAYSATWPASNPTSQICFIVRVRDDGKTLMIPTAIFGLAIILTRG